jgi:hypothetical protein
MKLTKTVLLYNEHTRKMFSEDILRLQRIKSSIEHLHHIEEDKRQHPNVFFMELALIYCMLRGDMAMVFNAPFNNISAISRRSALMLEETGAPESVDRP